jgi:hypothetical protein
VRLEIVQLSGTLEEVVRYVFAQVFPLTAAPLEYAETVKFAELAVRALVQVTVAV